MPVYAPPYAAALIEDRLGEHRLKGIDLRVSPAGSRERIGPIGVERFSVHHSIADATGLILDTPVGTVVHTGDFKLDPTPIDAKPKRGGELARVRHGGLQDRVGPL